MDRFPSASEFGVVRFGLPETPSGEGKRVIARLRISVTDASGLVNEARATVRPARTAGAGPIGPEPRRTLELDVPHR